MRNLPIRNSRFRDSQLKQFIELQESGIWNLHLEFLFVEIVQRFEHIVLLVGGFLDAFVSSHLEEVDFALVQDPVGLHGVHDVVIDQSTIDAHGRVNHLPHRLADRDAVFGMHAQAVRQVPDLFVEFVGRNGFVDQVDTAQL